MSEEIIKALALHTVTRPDGLGGLESHHRGHIFDTDEIELNRLTRHGAARRATDAEIKASRKGAVAVDDLAISRSYSQTEALAQSRPSVHVEEDGSHLGDELEDVEDVESAGDVESAEDVENDRQAARAPKSAKRKGK